MNSTTHPANDRLREFMVAMTEWELQSRELVNRVRAGEIDIAAVSETQENSLKEIQRLYCASLKNCRVGMLFQYPPQYDPNTVAIVETISQGPKKALIVLQQATGAKRRIQIEMKWLEEKWWVWKRRDEMSDGKLISCEL